MPNLAKVVFCSALLSASFVHAQATRKAAPNPLQANQSVIDSDSRISIRAFREELKAFYDDSQDTAKSDKIPQDLSELRMAANARTASTMLNPGLSVLVDESAFSDVIKGLSQTRPDKQVAAQATSSASTSLVSKPGGSSILALAVDAGALTSSVSGTTSTVSGNLEGIGSLLLGQSPIAIDPNDQGWLRKISGAVNLLATFALAQPSSQSTSMTQPASGSTPPAGTQVSIPSSVGKLTGITAQFAIHNPFDPHSSTVRKNWDATKPTLANAEPSLLQAASPVVSALDCAACQNDWITAKAALSKAAKEQNQGELVDAFDLYVTSVIAHARAADSNFDSDVVNAVKATATYQDVVHQAVASALGNLFTLEYDFSKPANQPEAHDFKLVYGYAMSSSSAINSLLTAGSGAKSLFTANADISIYGNAIPASAKYGRLHYGQLSAEFDRPIIGATPARQAVFSVAAYWQYQPSPSVLNITQSEVAPGTSIDESSQVLVGTAGSLWVTQAKITINNGKSGINVPIGVKWSNKTTLLTGSKVGAQIGISYDFSSLSNLFGGGG